ncbi:MarR family winged helix-turn-helix transcriptional regulator [Amycolatopsis thermophila]|uniref:DNA-binding MarR family transcriptional regulator n=1 Tax=Amycolatopsis thermophila TaxID=206084 RepID=A0ABU0EP14_9PSEU|nr:MarR family transcriptional regulator [Amycolatopsis thermophila]MDQ0377038.1 DNA-binding MarR family transcriptional regulator [Amycolatopsis thermophila]
MTEAERVWALMQDLVLHRHDRRKAVTEALGLSFVKTKALRRLAPGPLTLGELAELLHTDRPYTTIVVDDLEQRGLVSRTVHPDDRRRRLVAVTPAGAEAAAAAGRLLSEPPPFLAALDGDELAELGRLLTKLDGAG